MKVAPGCRFISSRAGPTEQMMSPMPVRREKITGKDKANRAHREVGAKVRQTIKELGGTMPEELPAVESIKKLESKARKVIKKPKA